MSGIGDYFDEEDDEDEFPLSFMEVTGDHAITDPVRKAIVWASIKRFLDEDVTHDDIESSDFSDTEKLLSKYVYFHGPYTDIDVALESGKQRKGIIVAPRHKWSNEESEFVFVAVLAS